MSALSPQTSPAGGAVPPRPLAGDPDGFEAAMNSGAPIVDNASTRLYAIGELEPDDQPERPDGECGFCGGVGTIDDGDRLCPIGCWRVTA